MKKQTNLFWILVLMALTISLPSTVFSQKGKGKTVVKKPVSQPKTSQGTLAFNEGKRLFDQGTAASYNSALQKYNEAIGHFERENNTEMLAETYLQMGRTHKRLNNFQESINTYGKAYQIFVKLGDNDGVADILNNTAVVFRDVGQFKDALENYQESLPLMRAKKDKRGEAQVLNGIGESMVGLGNVNEAMPFLQQALAIWQTLGASEDRVRTLYNLGRANFVLGDTQQGLSFCQQALSDSRQYNNPLLEGDILETMAQHYNETGNLIKAVELRNQIFTAYNNSKASTVTPYRVMLSLVNLTYTYFKAGDFQTGFKLSNDGINYATRHKEDYMMSYVQGNTGSYLYEQGKFNESIPYLNKGIAIAGQAGNKSNQSFYYAVLGLVYLEMEDFEQAENSLNQAKQLMQPGKDNESSQGIILSSLIRLYAEQGEKGKVNEYINEGRSLGLDKGKAQGAIQFLAAVASSQLKAGKAQEAVQTFNQAFALATKIGHEVEKAKILYEISYAYLQSGNAQNAVNAAQFSHDFFKKIGNTRKDMLTHIQMGSGLMQMNQLQPAFQQFSEALTFAQTFNDTESQMLIYFKMGEANRMANYFDNAIQNYNQAFQIAENTQDKDSQKLILNEIGDTYEKSGNKKKAKEFRDKAKKIKN